MHVITFSPVRLDKDILIDVEGDSVWIEGVEYNFAPLPDGAILPATAVNSPHFTGEVKRVGAELHYTLILPFGANASDARRFPARQFVDVGSVNYVLPPFDESEVHTDDGMHEPEVEQPIVEEVV